MSPHDQDDLLKALPIVATWPGSYVGAYACIWPKIMQVLMLTRFSHKVEASDTPEELMIMSESEYHQCSLYNRLDL